MRVGGLPEATICEGASGSGFPRGRAPTDATSRIRARRCVIRAWSTPVTDPQVEVRGDGDYEGLLQQLADTNGWILEEFV